MEQGKNMFRNKKISRKFPSLFLAAALLLGACTGGSPNLGNPGNSLRVWIDQPRDGSSIPAAPINLVASARSVSGAQVNLVQFLVNGQDAGQTNFDTSQNPPQAQLEWTPPAPGQYTIQAVALSADGRSASSEISHICVIGTDGSVPDGCPAAPAQPTTVTLTPSASTQTPTPTESKPPAQPGPIEFKTGANPAVAWFGKCDNQPTQIAIEAAVSDTSAAIEVDLQLALQDASGARRDAGIVSMQPQSGGYLYTVDTTTLPTGSLGDALLLIYKVTLLDQNKQFYASSPEGQVSLLACQPTGSITQPPAATTQSPTIEPIIVTPSFTPKPLIPTKTFTPVPPAIQKPTGYASAKQVYYTTGCGENTLTVFARPSDPGSVKLMRVHWVYTGAGTGTEKIYDMNPDGKGGFSLMIMDPTNFQAYPNLKGANGQIQYWFEVVYGSGMRLTSDPGYVSVSYCPG